jgi:hypothetical protein
MTQTATKKQGNLFDEMSELKRANLSQYFWLVDF